MQERTDRVNLLHIPATGTHLMEVAPGVPVDFALSKAECLDMAVRKLLKHAVSEGGMETDIAFLCEFALDASNALRSSAGTTV